MLKGLVELKETAQLLIESVSTLDALHIMHIDLIHCYK